MRLALALLIGIGLGAGGMWLALETPWRDSNPYRSNAQAVADELLRRQRHENPRLDYAECFERQATNGLKYECTVEGPDVRDQYRAIVRGDRVSFELVGLGVP